MKIELRKITTNFYNDLIDNINNNLDFYMSTEMKSLKIYEETFTLEEISEPINANEKVEIDINVEDLIFSASMMQWKKNFLVGKLLHKKLGQYEKQYFGLFNETGFWTYLCHLPIFRNYIIKRYLVNQEKDSEEQHEEVSKKILRYFFCKGHCSRTGILFNWLLTACLYDDRNLYELSEVAFSFIDSVKAIYERSFHKNNLIVKAFVQGIINNNRSSAFKDPKYRSIIPTHISNIAALNLLDSYDNYHELVGKITFEQRKIIILYNEEKLTSKERDIS